MRRDNSVQWIVAGVVSHRQELLLFVALKVGRSFLELLGVDDQPGHEVGEEVDRAAVVGVFDLVDVLELVVVLLTSNFKACMGPRRPRHPR